MPSRRPSLVSLEGDATLWRRATSVMTVPYIPDVPLPEDVIGQQEPDGRPRKVLSTKHIPAALAGLAVGAAIGVLLATQLRQEEPGPIRAFAFVGLPRSSLGGVVVPVSVVNAGTAAFRVADVRGPDGVGATITYGLRTESVVVPAGEAQEVLVSVSRDCQDDRRTATALEFDIVVRADESSTTQSVPIYEGFGGFLPGFVPCDGE